MKKLAKTGYRFRKQWSSIISALRVPENIPLEFAKTIWITLDDEVITLTSEEAFKNQLSIISDDEKNILDINLELNYQKIIDTVESKCLSILQSNIIPQN